MPIEQENNIKPFRRRVNNRENALNQFLEEEERRLLFGNLAPNNFEIHPIPIDNEEPVAQNNDGIWVKINDMVKEKYSFKSYIINKDNVKLYESNKEVPVEEAVYVHNIAGYVLKDDKRIQQDYLHKRPILIDEKTINKLTVIYNKMDLKGKLYDEKYTDVPSNFIISNLTLPLVKYKLKTVPITMELYEDSYFHTKYTEDVNKGIFYKITPVLIIENKKPKVLYRKRKGDFGSFLYSIKNKPNTFVGTHGKKNTFGIEIETCSGRIPEYLDKFLYYSAVHDGSLRDEDDNQVWGGEYVTDVLQGDYGLKQLRLLTNELTKRCLVNKKCSVHAHIGNVNFSKENIVLMYYLYQLLEEELFNMMPQSRRKNEYCRKLDAIKIDINNIVNDRNYFIDSYYNKIINVLSRREGCSKKVNKKHDHPQGFKCGYDHATARYCWVNFIPAVFDTRRNREYTIEFRLFSATTSYYKIKNWLLICMALTDIVENYKQEIYNGQINSLNDVIQLCYKGKASNIIEFIEKRKSLFADNNLVEQLEFDDSKIITDMSYKTL